MTFLGRIVVCRPRLPSVISSSLLKMVLETPSPVQDYRYINDTFIGTAEDLFVTGASPDPGDSCFCRLVAASGLEAVQLRTRTRALGGPSSIFSGPENAATIRSVAVASAMVLIRS